ncbi:MAG: hypothetical protein H6P96_573 [Candidatus Aminicenantes bacterium]|nr:hypothetical protein [Candidatus Aminicenantes bacterium]
MTPPFAARARSWSSVRLRGLSQTARALEWEAKIRGVRDVDEHAQAVAFGHDLAPEIAQPLVLGIAAVGRGVADIVVGGMAESDVADAQVVEGLDERKILADGVAVLHADEGREPALFLETPGAGRVDGQSDHRGVRFRHLPDGRDGLESSVFGFGVALGCPGPLADERGEELGVETALLHPGQVDLAGGAQRRVVALADLPVLPEQAEGRVAVGVDGQYLPVELPGLRGDGRRRLGRGAGSEDEGEQGGNGDPDHRFLHVLSGIEALTAFTSRLL